MRVALFIPLALVVALVAAVPGAAAALAAAAPCACCEHAADGPTAGECCTMTPASPDHQAVLTSPPARPGLVPVPADAMTGNPVRPHRLSPPTEWRPPGPGRRTYLQISILRI